MIRFKRYSIKLPYLKKLSHSLRFRIMWRQKQSRSLNVTDNRILISSIKPGRFPFPKLRRIKGFQESFDSFEETSRRLKRGSVSLRIFGKLWIHSCASFIKYKLRVSKQIYLRGEEFGLCFFKITLGNMSKCKF